MELAQANSPDARGFALAQEGVETKASGNCWGPYVLHGYSWVQFHYACERIEGRDVVYNFWVLGRPDRPVKPEAPVWVSGALRIRKP